MTQSDIGIVEKLKACPFCGRRATLVVPGPPHLSAFPTFRVDCKGKQGICPARCSVEVVQSLSNFDKERGIKEVVELWNTRTPDPIIMEMVEALELGRTGLVETQRVVFEVAGYSAAEIDDALSGFVSANPTLTKIDATLVKVRGK